MAKAVAPSRTQWPLGRAVVLSPASAVAAFARAWRAGVQRELGCRALSPQGEVLGWGLRAAVFTHCHSARPHSSRAGPTPSPQHSEVVLLPGLMHASVSTRRRVCPSPPPHLLLARPLARAPALPLPNGPLCSCASITPRVRGSHICTHTCSLQAGAPLGIPKFCLRMPGLPRVAGAIPHPPTHLHPKSCRPPPASTGTLPTPWPLAHSEPSGLRAHAATYGSAAHQLLGRGRKKNPTDSAERGGGERERKRERMTDCNPP